jgi:hypothetical protein
MSRRSRSAWIGRRTIVCLAVAALLLQACNDQSRKRAPAPAVSPAVRTIQFRDGGRVTVERKGDDDEVNVEDAKGQLVSQSWCPVVFGSFDATSALFRQLQKAVAAGDKPAVAALMQYPLRVNGKSRLDIESSADLLRRYQKVFTADLIKQILAANPQVVFCRYDGNMFADGAVWANNDNGRMAVYAINQ